MKIKTITCHDVYNVGASLQAYALATYLKGLGHEVEIIDYKPEYLSRHFPLFGLNNPRYDKPLLREAYQIAKLPGRIRARNSRRKKVFDSFTKTYLPITKVRYTSSEAMKKNPPLADAYFAGSDQIWNTFFQNGKDPAFYLDFAPENSVRASYAASFSTKAISEEWKPQVKKWLSALDFISVRESSGVKLIEDLGINNVCQVLDPVFLLGLDEWKGIEEGKDIQEKYIFLYDFESNSVIREYVKCIAKRMNWKIYSLFPCDYCDRCFVNEGPLFFLNLIHHAEFVVTNSFHATAFSLIYHKQFVVFFRNEKINARVYDLLKLVNLQNRVAESMDDLENKAEINYPEIQSILSDLILKSKKYINIVLEGKNDSD